MVGHAGQAVLFVLGACGRLPLLSRRPVRLAMEVFGVNWTRRHECQWQHLPDRLALAISIPLRKPSQSRQGNGLDKFAAYRRCCGTTPRRCAAGSFPSISSNSKLSALPSNGPEATPPPFSRWVLRVAHFHCFLPRRGMAPGLAGLRSV